MRPVRSLAERQAKVGILANPVPVRMPTHPPRDIWNRWPSLRSRRRLLAEGKVYAEPPAADPLQDLRAQYRQTPQKSWLSRFWPD